MAKGQADVVSKLLLRDYIYDLRQEYELRLADDADYLFALSAFSSSFCTSFGTLNGNLRQ